LKIIHIVENLDDSYGGPAKSVPYLVKYLSELGVRNEICSINCTKSNYNSVIDKYNLDWKSFKIVGFDKLKISLELKNYVNNRLKEDGNIILHTHNIWNYIQILAFQLSKEYNVPHVVSIRGALYDWCINQGKIRKYFAWELYQRKILNSSNCLHATNIGEFKAIRKLGIKSDIEIIENGVNLDEFDNLPDKISSKKKLGLPNNKKYILFLSRIHPKKGLIYLIKAWSVLEKQNPNWILLIVGPVGDQLYMTKIEKWIHKHNMSSRIIFYGILNGDKRLLAYVACEFFVLPSYSENFGICVAEALAAKRPVITTWGTPWREIRQYKAGWWIKLGEAEITKTLNIALNNTDEELQNKGLRGYELIKNYRWENKAQKMKQLYDYISRAKEAVTQPN
jgi:glycosyltransferase involved in cell wall biosynthesis